MMGNYFGNMMGGGFGFGFGWIINLLFWGLIIWAVVVLIQRLSGGSCSHCHGGHEKKSDEAMDILKGRYAKGEVSKEEFDRMKKDLE